jgi:hypothetical protein
VLSVPAKSGRISTEKSTMGRHSNKLAAVFAGMPPIREWWRQINREEREEGASVRANRKARDKKRRKCRCEAYPWPHRAGGGLCRWPDPPLERWQPKPGGRPYRKRYAGLVRQIARNNGLHPVRDRALIEELMPRVLAQAKLLHERCPRVKYRNIEITDTGVRGHYQTAGTMM